VEVLFRTGELVHRLPEPVAVLLAENLRAWPLEEDVSRSAADRIELYLVGETTEPIEFEGPERSTVRQALDVLAAGPHNSPALHELWECLGIEPRRRR
jgi:hypothetical protein